MGLKINDCSIIINTVALQMATTYSDIARGKRSKAPDRDAKVVEQVYSGVLMGVYSLPHFSSL